MNWNKRYAMDKDDFDKAWQGTPKPDDDTFFCGDGVLKVGPKYHQITEDRRRYKPSGRGALLEFPNGHQISVTWHPGTYSDNFRANSDTMNEFPKRVEVAHFNPGYEFVSHPEVTGWGKGGWEENGVGTYLDHEAVNKLIEYVKGL